MVFFSRTRLLTSRQNLGALSTVVVLLGWSIAGYAADKLIVKEAIKAATETLDAEAPLFEPPLSETTETEGSGVEEQPVVFDRDIQPILGKCASCHGGVKKAAGLSVLSRDLILTETDYGDPAIVVGDSSESELFRLISSDDPDERMPPDEPLEAEEIETLRRWIDQGVDWPDHWAYHLPETVRDTEGENAESIDAIVYRRLREEEVSPSPPADRVTLLRRLSLDLTGLLPTPLEVEDFVRDSRPDAYALLVERLLASPHFGERWARHWLDEARYADTEGYEKDSKKEDAYRFRDWVIQSFNQDMPFDQFTIAQIAGDLLPDKTKEDLIATKFHLQAQFNLEGGVDAEEDRTKRVIDRVGTIGSVWLGMTIGCCQCHDHPYDPVSQRDFYAMYAFFNNTGYSADLIFSLGDDAENDKKLLKERIDKAAELEDLLSKQLENKSLSNRVQEVLLQLRVIDNQNGFVRFLKEREGDRRTTYVLSRGDFMRPLVEEGEVVPDTPTVLPTLSNRGEVPDRLDLAEWLVAPENPLVARVAVNKIWMHLFDKPLVASPGNFGTRGELVNHPELLDWLANWYVKEAAWSRKALIRLIVHSETYRQSSDVRPELLERDPENHFLARQNRYRVEAEILRDIALQASGLLSRKMGGPSVFPPMPLIIVAQSYETVPYVFSEGEDRYRRGLYTFFKRTAIDPNLATFDCPDSSMSKPRRDHSNNALQALATLQNEVFHEAAQRFAGRLIELSLSGGLSDRSRLRQGFMIAVSREPREAELALLESLLKESREYYGTQPEEAKKMIGNHGVKDIDPIENASWVATTRVILNLDEFLTRN